MQRIMLRNLSRPNPAFKNKFPSNTSIKPNVSYYDRLDILENLVKKNFLKSFLSRKK